MQLILYTKPGCHLCEGLEEKLRDIQTLPLDLEIRDITTQPDWFQRYQYEIPVLHQVLDNGQVSLIPRFSPRLTSSQIAQILEKYKMQESVQDSETIN